LCVTVDDVVSVVTFAVDAVVAPKVPFITAPVSVLLVNVSVVALPTKVSVAAGSVKVVVPATAVACNVVVPDVEPEISTALGFRDTVVAMIDSFIHQIVSAFRKTSRSCRSQHLALEVQ
jgi:hypothetical protein